MSDGTRRFSDGADTQPLRVSVSIVQVASDAVGRYLATRTLRVQQITVNYGFCLPDVSVTGIRIAGNRKENCGVASDR